MESIIAVTVGMCLGFSPLGTSRVLKIVVMALTGG